MPRKKIDVLTIIEIIVIVALIGGAIYFLWWKPSHIVSLPKAVHLVPKSLMFSPSPTIITSEKIHSILDYTNQLVGIIGGIVAILIGGNSLRRNKRKIRAKA